MLCVMRSCVCMFLSYRNSVLTRLLMDSLGGSAFTCVICAVSPAPQSVTETSSSLRFAERAKLIKNTVNTHLHTNMHTNIHIHTYMKLERTQFKTIISVQLRDAYQPYLP